MAQTAKRVASVRRKRRAELANLSLSKEEIEAIAYLAIHSIPTVRVTAASRADQRKIVDLANKQQRKLTQAEMEKIEELSSSAYNRHDFHDELLSGLIKIIPDYLKKDAVFRMKLSALCKQHGILSKYNEIYEKVVENV